MANEGKPTCCTCIPVVGTRFGGEHDRQPSVAIIEAVAAAEGVAPAELDPLHEQIDLDAVNQLFAGTGSAPDTSKSLRFSAAGWNVFVRGDGAIRVCDPDDQAEPAEVFEKPLCD
jgi:hypothetical protein